jgi:hypothetical protein
MQHSAENEIVRESFVSLLPKVLTTNASGWHCRPSFPLEIKAKIRFSSGTGIGDWGTMDCSLPADT